MCNGVFLISMLWPDKRRWNPKTRRGTIATVRSGVGGVVGPKRIEETCPPLAIVQKSILVDQLATARSHASDDCNYLPDPRVTADERG